VRAAAALALSGRYAPFGRQAAAGLRVWAQGCGAHLLIEDDRSDAAESARLLPGLARAADLTFGPYGSGSARAAAQAMAGRPEVVWNHGGAEVPRTGARVIDVLGPAGRYWRGLADVLGAVGADLSAVAVARAPGGFGRAVAGGATESLAAAGARPVVSVDLDPRDPGSAVAAARAGGARWVVGGGRAGDDLALGHALVGTGIGAGLVVCGVALAGQALGDAVSGWIGPVQWAPSEDGPAPPLPLPPGADYPAAQALAAGLVAQQALALAGGSEPGALWDAARALRTTTFLGPFAVDAEGRQTAHSPSIVRWTGAGEDLRRVVVWRPPATA
jgi:ABC-type branched-subunit amino acid transport system substrate-binding protein